MLKTTKPSQELRVATWNTRCNNSPISRNKEDAALRKQSLINQLLRLEEEVKEVREAIEKGDDDNLAQELADVLVVTHGLTYLAQLPVSEVFERKADNNDLKYTLDYEFAIETLEHLGGEDKFNIQEVEQTIFSECQGVDTSKVKFYSVHRNLDNKICKLKGHPSIDCSDLTMKVE